MTRLCATILPSGKEIIEGAPLQASKLFERREISFSSVSAICSISRITESMIKCAPHFIMLSAFVHIMAQMLAASVGRQNDREAIADLLALADQARAS
jgi:hypothetical protein